VRLKRITPINYIVPNRLITELLHYAEDEGIFELSKEDSPNFKRILLKLLTHIRKQDAYLKTELEPALEISYNDYIKIRKETRRMLMKKDK
jgi:hypothetical protein